MKWLKKQVIDFPLELNISYRKAAPLLGIDSAQLHRQVTGRVIMSEKAAQKLLAKIEKLKLRKKK
jgi:hypothetical protein